MQCEVDTVFELSNFFGKNRGKTRCAFCFRNIRMVALCSTKKFENCGWAEQ